MKTEKEKMLAGEVYDCADNELLTRWHKAKQLQQEYNNTLTTDAGKISDLLDELIGSRGDNVWISAPFFVDYGENIYIGKNVEINMNCVFLIVTRLLSVIIRGLGREYIFILFFILQRHRKEPLKTVLFGSHRQLR